MKRMDCGIAVIGAGPAGMCAAIAAARHGADTVLVSDRPVLGGNSSSEVRVWTRGATGGGNLFAEEMGIWGELKLRRLHDYPTGSVLGWDDVLLDAALREENLRFCLNTAFCDVQMDGKHIRGVTLFSSRTQEKIALHASMYIDCTGDGALGAAAGVAYRQGREGRDELREPLAQREGDQKTLGCSILIQTKRVDHPVPYRAPDYAYSIEEIAALVGRGGRIVTADMQGSDCWWFEYGGQLDPIANDPQIYIELRRIATGIFNYIKNSGEFDADNLELEWMGTLPGKRASRRLTGRTTLLQQDVEEDRYHDEAVCWGGWFMDSHPSGGIQSEKEECVQRSVHVYGIPFGCFYHDAFDNLLFAGRDASQSHVALTSARIMNTCALMGQAVGTAAAMCVEKGVSPTVLHECHGAQLQNRLAWDDVLISRPLPMPDGMNVTASSVMRTTADLDGTRLALSREAYAVWPAQCGGVALWMEAEQATALTMHLSRAALPSRRAVNREKTIQVFLNPGVNRVAIGAQPGEAFVMLRFEPNAWVALLGGDARPGIQAGLCMEPKVFHPAIDAEREIYMPDNLTDGYVRPWNGAHAWAAGAQAAELSIRFDQAREMDGVSLYFDPELSMELTSSHCARWNESHHFDARLGMPRQLVRSYRVIAHTPLGDVVLCDVTDNHKRLAVHRFERLRASGLTLDIRATYGRPAVVYAIVPHME